MAQVVQWEVRGLKGQPTIAVCAFCGAEYKTYPSYLNRRSSPGYCSRACYFAAETGTQRVERVTVTCPVCGITKQYLPSAVRTYCSRACCSKALSGEQSGNWKGLGLNGSRVCTVCGKEFKARGITAKTQSVYPNTGSYCSRACYCAAKKAN